MLSLNLKVLSDLLIRRGLNQAQLAERLKVSREAVSKWFSGESFPHPDKLLRIGMELGATFDEIVQAPSDAQPIVYYRKKGSRKTKPENLAVARERGEMLKRLTRYLPHQRLTQPPTLQNPTSEYGYVQRVAADVRCEMGIKPSAKLGYEDLIGKFAKVNAVIIPVMWGAQVEHGNALNVYLPDSATSWVFLNLDSNAVDFNFWMAHELGHSLAPALGEELGEVFADAFAQALLFSDTDAETLRSALQKLAAIGQRITRVKAEAEDRLISPLTIRYALQAYEVGHGLEHTDLGEMHSFMGSVKNFGKGYKTITEALFDKKAPKPSDYVADCKKFFKTPFFDALAAFCREEKGSEHFIHQVLGLPLADAKALSVELRE